MTLKMKNQTINSDDYKSLRKLIKEMFQKYSIEDENDQSQYEKRNDESITKQVKKSDSSPDKNSR